MDIVRWKHDVWGREVLLGISWDLLWVVLALSFTAVAVHLVVMAVLRREPRPSAAGRHLARHAAMDRAFHWVAAISVFALLVTGIAPVLGIDFAWLTLHWVAGLVLTAVVALHVIRALFWQDVTSMNVGVADFAEPFERGRKPGKYSLAQKGMHHAMTLFVLLVIGTGLVLLAMIDTPWWERSNALSESTLGWTFVLHGASTLGLVGLVTLHVYFALRPEKRFYTRSMISGWISEGEYAANHDPARWTPEESR